MAFGSPERRMTLSDQYDPIRPANPVPGGLIEEVSVSYDDANALAVGVNEAVKWANAAGTGDEKTELNGLLRATQRKIESQFGLALVPQAVTVVARGPSRQLELPRTPLTSLTTVKEIVDGQPQSDLSSDYYELHGVLRRTNGAAVGTDPVEVVYDAGFADPPEQVRLAIKRIVTDHFDYRTDQTEDAVETIPRDAESLLREFID